MQSYTFYCDQCRALSYDELRSSAAVMHYPYHESWKSLEESAEAGCALCGFFRDELGSRILNGERDDGPCTLIICPTAVLYLHRGSNLTFYRFNLSLKSGIAPLSGIFIWHLLSILRTSPRLCGYRDQRSRRGTRSGIRSSTCEDQTLGLRVCIGTQVMPQPRSLVASYPRH